MVGAADKTSTRLLQQGKCLLVLTLIIQKKYLDYCFGFSRVEGIKHNQNMLKTITWLWQKHPT